MIPIGGAVLTGKMQASPTIYVGAGAGVAKGPFIAGGGVATPVHMDTQTQKWVTPLIGFIVMVAGIFSLVAAVLTLMGKIKPIFFIGIFGGIGMGGYHHHHCDDDEYQGETIEYGGSED